MPAAEPPEPHPTRLRIMAAAEPLFARDGLAGVSLRQITSAAGVNLAAVNYHFYDKPTLYKELLVFRLRRINRERLTLLQALEPPSEPPTPPPALTDIIAALARPLFLPSAETGPHAPRLVGRLFLERTDGLDAVVREEVEPVLTRFGQACRRHAMALAPEDFMWRFSQMIGALHHAVLLLPDIAVLTRHLCRPEQAGRALANFCTSAAQGLQAPADRL